MWAQGLISIIGGQGSGKLLIKVRQVVESSKNSKQSKTGEE